MARCITEVVKMTWRLLFVLVQVGGYNSSGEKKRKTRPILYSPFYLRKGSFLYLGLFLESGQCINFLRGRHQRCELHTSGTRQSVGTHRNITQKPFVFQPKACTEFLFYLVILLPVSIVSSPSFSSSSQKMILWGGKRFTQFSSCNFFFFWQK